MNPSAHYAALCCPDHGLVYIGFSEYVKQLAQPNKLWHCPTCGNVAAFDDEYFDRMHKWTDKTQECSKLEHTFTYDQVIDIISATMQYVEDLEDAINSLGTDCSLQKSAKARLSRVKYETTLKPFKHLRRQNGN